MRKKRKRCSAFMKIIAQQSSAKTFAKSSMKCPGNAGGNFALRVQVYKEVNPQIATTLSKCPGL